MNLSDVRAGSIVVGVDGSVSSGRALGWAVDQAAIEGRPLTLAHAVDPAGAVWMDQAGMNQRLGLEAMTSAARQLLDLVRADVADRCPALVVHEVLRVVDPRDLLLALSAKAAMVVVGSRGRGHVESVLSGSVGLTLTRRAACPVVIHRTGHPGLVRHGVMVGADCAPGSEATVELAYRLASLRRLPLTVVHSYRDVRPTPGSPQLEAATAATVEEQAMLVSKCLAGLGERYPDVTVRTQVTGGHAVEVLTTAREHMDLIVIGAHQGRVAAEVLFGSVAASVVEHPTCPVVVVPLTDTHVA